MLAQNPLLSECAYFIQGHILHNGFYKHCSYPEYEVWTLNRIVLDAQENSRFKMIGIYLKKDFLQMTYV